MGDEDDPRMTSEEVVSDPWILFTWVFRVFRYLTTIIRMGGDSRLSGDESAPFLGFLGAAHVPY